MLKIILLILIISNIFFPQENTFLRINDAKDSVSAEKLSNHITQLENAGGHFSRVNFTPGNDSAVVYIKNEMLKLKHLQIELDTFYIESASSPYNNKPLFNVIGTLIGKKYPDQYYIIGAHLDCSANRMVSNTWNSKWETIKAPGADDNATGVAALLEIARILSDSTTGMLNDYSIKFVAFGAEESGPAYAGSHHGSLHFAGEASKRKESIPGMVSVDMIGFNNNYDYTSIVANANSQWLGEKFYQANEIYSIGLNTNKAPFPTATYSDHNSFWESNYNAILLIENAPPWENSPFYVANEFYHKSTDAFSTVNIELVKKVTQLTLCTIASLSSKLTDVNENETVPTEFNLSQNYPNPFNSSTRIEYSITSNSYVSLKILNILGENIVELENSYKTPGTYSIRYDAGSISSGVYFYELIVNTNGSFSRLIRKMNLLK